jgi:hypothetical protein
MILRVLAAGKKRRRDDVTSGVQRPQRRGRHPSRFPVESRKS